MASNTRCLSLRFFSKYCVYQLLRFRKNAKDNSVSLIWRCSYQSYVVDALCMKDSLFSGGGRTNLLNFGWREEIHQILL